METENKCKYLNHDTCCNDSSKYFAHAEHNCMQCEYYERVVNGRQRTTERN